MSTFLEKHADHVHGTLSCFDRVLFRGYLPIENGWNMAELMRSVGVQRHTLKTFLVGKAEALKNHACALVGKAGRPYRYLNGPERKEDLAREIAVKDGIEEGLVCVFSVLEPCRTFSLVWKEDKPFIRPAKRKCLFLYYYFVDRDLGLIHVKLQTWFPFRIQVYVNGHEWLARKLERHGVKFLKCDNAFARVEDLPRAQRLADRFESLPWVETLEGYARRVNPFLSGLLGSMRYYWATAQAEYSTDVLFKNREALAALMPRLVDHALVSFNASDVMGFLGRELTGRFKGELVSDLKQHDLKGRRPGRRVKHRMKANWLKMYDKAGTILRVEMVINQPEEFRVRRRVHREGKRVTQWVPMRKGVRWLFRYRDISHKCNLRYLNALSAVADPSAALRQLDRLTTRRRNGKGRTVRPFNPLARTDRDVFRALLAGEHFIHGFSNKELRRKLAELGVDQPSDARRQSSRASRLLARLHTYGLVAKIPRSRRWRVSADGCRAMSAAIRLREERFPDLHAHPEPLREAG